MPSSHSHLGHVPPSGEERDVLWVPDGYARDGSRRGIVFCHGAGELAATPLTGTAGSKAAETRLLWALASRYPMVMFDAGAGSGTTSPDNWGNANAVTRLGQAITWLQTPAAPGLSPGGGGAATGKVFLVAISMGSLLALNYAQAHPASVAAIVGILPAIDLDNIRDNTAFKAAISSAWGTGTWTAPGTPALPGGANPAVAGNHSAIGAIPQRLYYAPDDAIVATATVTAFASAVGSSVSLVNLGAGGHSDASVGHVSASDVLAFLGAHA